MLAGNFERTLKVPDPVDVARNVFQPSELPILKQHIISCHIVRFNTLKGNRKSYRCGYFESEIMKKVNKIV